MAFFGQLRPVAPLPLIGASHPAFLLWRNLLETTYGRFNVVTGGSHVCGDAIKPFDPFGTQLHVHVCYDCGAFHQCRHAHESHQNRHRDKNDHGTCTAVRSDDASYRCVFSGSVLSDPDFVLGTFDTETQAREAAELSHPSSLWVHVDKTGKELRATGNVHTGAMRNQYYNKSDSSNALFHSMLTVNHHSRMLSRQNKKQQHKKNTSSSSSRNREFHGDGGGGDGNDDYADAMNDNHHYHHHQEPAGSLLRRGPTDKSEIERDTSFQREFFRPLEAKLRHLHGIFHSKKKMVKKEKPQDSTAEKGEAPPRPPLPPPPPPPPLSHRHHHHTPSKKPSVSPKTRRHVEVGRERLTNSLRHVIAIFDALTAPFLDAAPEYWPSPVQRLTYFSSVMLHLIPLVAGKPLQELQDAELNKYVAVLMLDVFASTMRDTDSMGDSLFLWAADPWLFWCKQRCKLSQTLGQFATWNEKATKPYLERTAHNPSRKRKRRNTAGTAAASAADALSTSTTGITSCPVSEEAVRVLREAPEALRRALIQSARNISHQGNAIRTAIHNQAHSPQTVYTIVHQELLVSHPL